MYNFTLLIMSWQFLAQFRSVATDRCSTGGSTFRGFAPYLARVLPAMDELLAHLKSAKITYLDTSIYSLYLLTSINHGWSVLDMSNLLQPLYALSLNICFNNSYNIEILNTRYYALASVRYGAPFLTNGAPRVGY